MKDQQNELLTLADKVVSFGAKQVDQIEIMIQDNFEIGCEIQLGELAKAIKSQDAGASIQCIIKKRMGSAFTNRLDFETLKETVKRAVAAAKASTPDETWQDLPRKAKYASPKETWDDTIPTKNPSEFVSLITELAKKIQALDEEIIIGEAGVGGSFGWNAYANSNGISVADRATIAYAYAYAVAPIKTGMTPGVVAVDVKRSFDLDLEYIVKTIGHDIMLAKKTAKGKTEDTAVVFSADTIATLLNFTLIPALRGENVVRKKSFLANRKGDQVASKALTLIDDGIRPGAFSTSVFDGEGVPRQTTSIIENGKLKSFLWNTYWANRHGETSTGNASRNLRTGVLEINPTNIIVSAGTRSFEDLIGSIKSGYLIKGLQGAHSSNQETGDYSVVGNPAFRIENGELTGAVHGLMLAGNAFDLIQKVDELGSDVRSYLVGGSGSVIGPSIRFADVRVVAKAD